MCLLIAKPAGKEVPEEHIRQAAKRNHDGYGIVWHNGTSLQMWKHLTALEATIEKLKELKDHPALIHLRYATHGKVDIKNIHPFYVDDERTVAVAHNGQLEIRKTEWPDLAYAVGPEAWQDPIFVRQICRVMYVEQLSLKDEISDTRLFADHVLAHLDHKSRWWKSEDVMDELSILVGGDRMALITEQDGIVLINPKSFIEEGGIFYSNAQYKAPFEPRSRVGDTDDSDRLDDWWNKRLSPAKNVVSDDIVGSINPFTPIEQDDHLVAYFFTPEERASYVECVACRKDQPKFDEAHAIFASDLDNILQESCTKCSKTLNEIAEIVAEMAAIVKQVDEQADTEVENPDSLCCVCGNAECECTVGDVFDKNKPHLATLADILNNESLTAFGLSHPQLQTIAIKVKEGGDDISKISLLEATEKYPDLFQEFAA